MQKKKFKVTPLERAWILYDVGNSAFVLMIATLVPIFFNALAEAGGVECMIGCMLESRLSVAASAHLAAARGVITRADLDGPSLCSTDPFTGGPVFDAATITMSDDPGIGVSSIPCSSWS